MSVLNKKDIIKQMYYFRLGLQEYNRYLRRHLDHYIKDIDKIFSKVSLLGDVPKTEIIHSLSNSFEAETDKLKPLKYISSELMPMLMESQDTEGFLIPQSLKLQLKVVGTFFISSNSYHCLDNCANS
jgi:hypothetical protein